MTFNILIQIPKLMWGIKQENQIVKNIIHDYNIDGIISDNRYGPLLNRSSLCLYNSSTEYSKPFHVKLHKKDKL